MDEQNNENVSLFEEEIKKESNIVENNDLISKEHAVKELAEKIKKDVKKTKQTNLPKKRPSLFVNNENIKVKVTVLYSYETGDILSIFAHTLPIEDKVKEFAQATSRVMTEEECEGEVCAICGKPAKKKVYFARAY